MTRKKEHKLISDVESKHCYKCDEWKPTGDFNKSKSNWDSLQNKCKSCERRRRKDIDPMKIVKCLFCKKEMSATKFDKNPRCKGTYQSVCTDCKARYNTKKQKICHRCHKILSADKFNYIKSKKCLRSYCNKCGYSMTQEWRKKNENRLKKYDKSYGKKYRAEHKEELKLSAKKRYQRDKKKINEKKKQRRNENIEVRILHNLRSRINKALRGAAKSKRTMELLGCTIEDLCKHLENQFVPEMTWENYGIRGWHVDHIFPCKLFDMTDLEEQKKCFHFTNLQPLWAGDNLSKNGRVEDPFMREFGKLCLYFEDL